MTHSPIGRCRLRFARRALVLCLPLAFLGGLAGCGGNDHVDAAPPVVEEAPPAAQPGRIEVIAMGADGAPLDGVQAAVVGSAASALTDAGGSAAIDLPARTTVLVRMSKAGYADNFRRVGFGVGSTATRVMVMLRPRDAAQALDAGAGGQIVGRDGATVDLPAGALVDAVTGAAVTGMVDVAMTPIDVGRDELRAFPGSFAGIDEGGARQLLATYGTTEFMLTQGGRRLNLATGRTATIELPIYTPLHTPGVAVAAGDSIPLWSLDERSGVWKQEGTGLVVSSAESPTGFAMRATVGHFSWWNCDIGVPTGHVDLDVETPDVDDADRVPDPRPNPDPLDFDTNPNHYTEGIDRLVHVDTRTADDSMLRQAGQDFEAAFDERNYKPRLDKTGSTARVAQGSVYVVARGLLVPAGRPLAMTACTRVKRGGPGFTPVDACGTATVTAALGATVKVTIKLRVGRAQDVPYITQQPRPVTTPPGQTATFTVTAIRGFGNDASGLTYQWTRNGTAIAGATAATYTTAAVTTADDRALYAVIVASPAGTTLSLPTRLTVEAPLPPPPPPPPANAGDRWVDVVAGNDANAGSDAAPLKTIAAAIQQVPSGSTIWLKDGVWTPADETLLNTAALGLNCATQTGVPGSALVPGTSIRAVNPGRVTIRFLSNSAFCLASTQIRGVRFEALHPAPITGGFGLWGTTPGDSLLAGVTLDGTTVGVRNGARLRIEPGGLANYGAAGDANGRAFYAGDHGSAIVVDGGRFDALVPMVVRSGSATGCIDTGSFVAELGGRIVLGGVDLNRGVPRDASKRNAIAIAACTGARVELDASSVTGFIGINGGGAAISATMSSVALSGATVLSGNQIGVSMFRSAITLDGGARIEGSVFQGIRARGGSSIVLRAGSSVRSNGGDGIEMTLGDINVSNLEITSADISGNALAGLRVDINVRCQIRRTTVVANTEVGVDLGTFGSCDLGTAASPGGNTFLNTGPNFRMATSKPTTALAVGNTWHAGEQGADAQGRYAVPAGQATLEVGGPVRTGRNYRVELNGRLRLAE